MTSDVGGSKPGGTKASEVMARTLLELPAFTARLASELGQWCRAKTGDFAALVTHMTDRVLS